MFPIPWNFPFRKKDGDITTIGEMVGGGGGGSSNIYHGATPPADDLGKEGDIYLYMPSEGVPIDFILNVTKALRGDNEVSYGGAQEIQLFFTKGGVSKNIIEFPNFYCEGSNDISRAFDGQTTGGSYWEQNSLPLVVKFGATVPSDWVIEKFVVWQRNSSSYADVWKTFTLSFNGTYIVNESNLTQSDWSGYGKATEFDIITQPYRESISTVFYKVKIGDVVKWIS